MMDIGRCAAERAVRDRWMVHEIVLFIHDRACTANEQQRIAVVQLSNLVRGQQLFATMSSDELKKLSKKSFFDSSVFNIYSHFLPCVLRADEI